MPAGLNLTQLNLDYMDLIWLSFVHYFLKYSNDHDNSSQQQFNKFTKRDNIL